MLRAHWIGIAALGLFASCQQRPEVFEQPKAQATDELSDASRPFICYFPEYCYQVTGLTEKPLRISHPTLKGKVFVSFLINSDLQISHEQVQAARLVWKASGAPRFTSQQALDSVQLQKFLPLVRPAIQSLHVQRSNRADRSICALERWAVPITFD
ncbi:hypothetical protein [Hymenobacter wooponensis]|uniref:Uncharacterized protein n=1 Tax=Hymenobacter wooponensis TaxID=1525360 RepID=A0A4Z0MJS6_9BACT|nr:hypothetical protein [Hymenobacter wooponensis]TGD79824.1 hypothetical protein EU557_16570 [Hymenobacter wooponensis]